MWRMNVWYLRDSCFWKHLRQAIQSFYCENEQTVTAQGTLWCAGKAVIRGIAKAYICKGKRKIIAKVTELEAVILRTERRGGDCTPVQTM